MVFVSAFVLWLLPVQAGAGLQQGQSPPGVGHPQSPGSLDRGLGEPWGTISGPKLEHLREDDRRKRLLSDTAKLVELSNELKSDVEKTPKDELSLDVVKKAAEIEKLAHDVKERMKS
jgi:hypothetical protein